MLYSIRYQDHTHIIQVNICSAVVSQHEVSDRIRTLNRVEITVVGIQKPGILLRDEFSSFFVRP